MWFKARTGAAMAGREEINLKTLSADAQANILMEREKIRADDRRATWTTLGSVFSVLIGAITLGYTIWSGQNTLRRQIEAQSLQSMFNTAYAQPHGADVTSRLVSMSRIMGSRLSPDVVKTIQDSNSPGLQDYAEGQRRRDDIIRLMAANPTKAHAVLTLWITLFPEDKKITDEIVKRWPSTLD